ncbi:hypothetical protein MPPM_3789 [Methylorubrum populi]|uniref:Uncharacterized protein n=1 Tax=Methylorubrum populi TaxID=223967 RepID=A0A160PHP7_9HYPH|nr:hypothetical protein [Methylorubrum populi]BAU92394.1 hypothetical protein MPPM_3789 [Methylorubrum populi]
MSVVLQTIDIETVRYVRVPAGSVPHDAASRAGTRAAGVVTDLARYQTLPSLQALALAIVAAVATTGLILLGL